MMYHVVVVLMLATRRRQSLAARQNVGGHSYAAIFLRPQISSSTTSSPRQHVMTLPFCSSCATPN